VFIVSLTGALYVFEREIRGLYLHQGVPQALRWRDLRGEA
jgi:hypothetical protein